MGTILPYLHYNYGYVLLKGVLFLTFQVCDEVRILAFGLRWDHIMGENYVKIISFCLLESARFEMHRNKWEGGGGGGGGGVML